MARFDMTQVSRRTMLILAAIILAGVLPADAQQGDPRRTHHRHRGDHDCARRALDEGRAKPLAEILPAVEAALGGQVIEIEMERCTDPIVYEVKVLRLDGRLVEAKVDAMTGKIIERDD